MPSRKVGLSEPPRIDDLHSVNSQRTPETAAESVAGEFFNTIGQKVTFEDHNFVRSVLFLSGLRGNLITLPAGVQTDVCIKLLVESQVASIDLRRAT